MIAPQENALAEYFPEPSREKDVLLIHVHEDGIVFRAQLPDEAKEPAHVDDARYSFFFTQGVHRHIRGKLVLTHLETYHVDMLVVF